MKWILFLLLSTVIFISLGLWYFQDPGSINITWLGYEIQLTLVAGFILLLFFFFIAALLIRVLRWFLGIPCRWLSFFRRSQDEKAKHELLDLLSSYEAEIFTEALQHQKKAAHTLSNNPIFLWISGKTFEKAEKPFEAEQCFMDLIKNPSTTFLGIKGQIRAAMHRGDFKSAYGLLKRAEKLTPTSPWVLKHLLALSREQKNFKEGETLILRLEDLGYFSPDQSKKQVAYLQYLEAIQPETSLAQKEVLLRQAHYLDPSLAEATQEFALLLQEQGFVTYALTALEATWAVNPSQALGDLYLKISLPHGDINTYQTIQNFVKNNPKNPESLLLLTQSALQAKLWGEARAHLTNLLKIKGAATSDAYHLFAKLELEEHQDWKAAMKWLEKGLHVPRHV